ESPRRFAVEVLVALVGKTVRSALHRPARPMQLEEGLDSASRLRFRPRQPDGDSRLAEQPLLPAAQVFPASEPGEELVPGAAQRNVRADEAQPRIAHDARVSARGGRRAGTHRAHRRKPLGEQESGRTLAPQAVEVAQVPLDPADGGERRLAHFGLTAWRRQHVEVIAAGRSVAEEGDARDGKAAGANLLAEERQEPHQPIAVAQGDGAHLSPGAEVLPPREEPVRRKKDGARARLVAERAPLCLEATGVGNHLGAKPGLRMVRKGGGGGCAVHVHSSLTQVATCSASAGVRSWWTGSSRTVSRKRSTSGNS